MTPHVHTWELINAALRRYRCTDPTCSVIGREKTEGMFYRQRWQEKRAVAIVPYVCQHGRTHCGAEAVHVGIDRNQNRCKEHHNPEAARRAS